MALWRCEGCTTLYAVGLSHCPRCRGTQFHEEGQRVPKISKHGGPSDKTLPAPDHVVVVLEPLTTAEVEDLRERGPAVHQAVPDPDPEGGELSSPGSSSSASTPRPPTSSEPSKPDHPKRARMTGNRSARGRTESSSASLTAGQKTAPTSGPDRD
jgi:hypothetical protein